MTTQFTLAFPRTPDYSAAALLPTSGTATARQLLAANTYPVIALHGPSGSGKTHLLHVWCAGFDASGPTSDCPSPPYPTALALDDLDQLTPAGQEQLFHYFNAMDKNNGRLVVASRAPVTELDLLPDLKSRLLLGLHIPLQPPTDQDLAPLLLKWAQERQLTLPDDVIVYLLARAERSVPTLRALVGHLDDLSLAQRRAITIPLARQLFS